MPPLFLGLAVVIIAALFQGSFAVPMAYARTWKWENSWMAFSVFGMIVFNLLFALASIPNLFEIYRGAAPVEFAVPLLFGVLYGLGAVMFGLGLAAVGFALGYAIMLGMVLGMGAFIPMAALHPGEILTIKGALVLTGLAVTLAGIGVSGYAGIRKEREQGGSAGEITRISKVSMRTGIIICLMSGLFSSSINIGFSLARPLVESALAFGAPEIWAGNVIWVILFSSGGVLNILYCARLMKRNGTVSSYSAPGSARNLLLLLCMSAMWIGSFILYGVGATMMGPWGTVIGWSVYMALSIAVANCWGIAQGEWRGASRITKLIMAQGAGILLCAIIVFAYSGTI